MPREPDADALRSLPLRDFVRAREALATRLERKGKADQAKRVRRLRRPSPVVWALNTLASGPGALGELAEAVGQLRRAQLGQGDVRAATTRYRAAIGPLLRGAAEQLRAAGVRVSPALERRLHDTLLAAVADRRLRDALIAGRLTEERAAAGFDVLASGPIPAGVRPRPLTLPSPSRGGEGKGRAALAAERASKAERRRQLRAEREARTAERRARCQAQALETAARRQERAAAAAEAKVEATRAVLLAQERHAADLRRAAGAARDAARAVTR
jgi:hypothetical protein